MDKMIPQIDEILKILQEFKFLYQDEFDLDSLGVFGSVARNEANSQSDIDIVFETEKPDLFKTVRMKKALEARLARPVDIVRLRAKMNPRLRNRILRDARFV